MSATEPQGGNKPVDPAAQALVAGDRRPRTPPRPHRWRRRILWGLLALVLLVGVAIALAPTIASRVAPGIAQDSINAQIPGRVAISRVNLSWTGPTVVGPVELLDDKGQRVATVSVEAPVSVWRVLRDRMWAARSIDVGEVKLSGKADIVRGPDGVTNVERALGLDKPRPSSPAQPSPPSGGGGGGGRGIQSARATLRLDALDLSFVDRSPSADPAAAAGIFVTGFGGPVSVDYRSGASGVAIVQADLSGAVRTGSPAGGAAPAGAPDKQHIVADATVNMDSAGSPAGGNIKLEITNVPSALVDMLANLGGGLAPSLGPRLDLKIAGSGTADKATANAALTADGAAIDLALVYDGQTLALSKPGRIWARSTQFVGGVPAMKPQLAGVAPYARLDIAPGVDISIDTLSVPLPKAALTGGTGGAAKSGSLLDRLDLRQATAKVVVKVDEIRGQVSSFEPAPAPSAEASPAAPPPATAPPQWQPFRVEPVTLTIDVPSLAQGADITTATRATVGSNPAGTLAANLHAGGLLDASGRLVPGIPRDPRGEVRLDNVATALLQPLVAGLGMPVVLQEDVGPTVQVALKAESSGQASTPSAAATGGAADLPPASIDASLKSDNVAVAAALRMDSGTIRTRDSGITARIRQAGPLARRVLTKPGTPSSIDISGPVGIDLAVTNVSAPVGGKIDPAAVAATLSLTVKDAVVRVLPPPQSSDKPMPPIAIASTVVTVTLPGAGGAPTAGLSASMSADNTPFVAKGELALPDLFKHWPPPSGGSIGDFIGAVNSWKPTGSVAITGIPASLAAGAGLGSGTPGPSDTTGQAMAMVRKMLGAGVDVRLALAPGAGDAADRTAVTASVKAAAVNLDAAADLGTTDVQVRSVVATAKVLPDDINPVLKAVAASPPAPAPATPGAPAAAAPPPAPQPPMALQSPATLRLALDPVRLPLATGAGGMPIDLAKAGDISATLSSVEPLLVANLPALPAGAAAGVRGLSAKVTAPSAALANAGNAAPAPIKATLDAELIDAKATPLGKVKVDGTGTLAREAPINATVALFGLQSGPLDALLAKDGALPGALGDHADLTLAAAYDQKTGGGTADLTIDSPRLKAASPVSVALDSEKLTLTRAGQITWSPDIAWLNRIAFPAQPTSSGADGAKPPPGASAASPAPDTARIDPSEPVTFTLALGQITLSRPKSSADGKATQGPLKPGVFKAGGLLTAPRIRILPGALGADGKELPPLIVENIRASMWLPEDRPGALAADFVSTVAGAVESSAGAPAGSAGAAPGPAKSAATVFIINFADPNGVPTPDKASLEAAADLQALPTMLVDLAARQGGLLAEAMGPVVSVSVRAKNLSQTASGGTLHAQLSSRRAQATLGGTVQGGAFIQGEPVELKLTQITPNLTRMLAGTLPVVGTLEKTPQDEPALLKGENLAVPIDGDLRKLTGTVSVSPGVARFTTTGPFEQLLKFAGQKQAGVVGRKLEPFVVHMAQGVLTYDRFKLSLGEFDVETRGSVNLVNKSIDVITYAPFFALTDEAAGSLNTNIAGKLGKIVPGGAIDRLTMVPIRTHGSLNSPKTEVDGELFFKEFGENLIKAPGNLIEDVGKGVLDPLLKKKDDKKKK